MNKESLHEIGMRHGTDKAYDHNFCNFYDTHLSSLRELELSVLEIGIYEGASLKMWSEYFPNSKIYGIDLLVEPECRLINEGNIQSFRVDQGSEEELKNFIKDFGPFDIVIDDGSHFTHHQNLSYKLFAEETPVFIWEDLHTSRMPHYIRTAPDIELPLDKARRLSQTRNNCFFFDRDGDENSVTFLIKNSDIK
jgi:hypothetical protein